MKCEILQREDFQEGKKKKERDQQKETDMTSKLLGRAFLACTRSWSSWQLLLAPLRALRSCSTPDGAYRRAMVEGLVAHDICEHGELR